MTWKKNLCRVSSGITLTGNNSLKCAVLIVRNTCDYESVLTKWSPRYNCLSVYPSVTMVCGQFAFTLNKCIFKKELWNNDQWCLQVLLSPSLSVLKLHDISICWIAHECQVLCLLCNLTEAFRSIRNTVWPLQTSGANSGLLCRSWLTGWYLIIFNN